MYHQRPGSLPVFPYFLIILLHSDALPTQNVGILDPGNATQQSTIFLVLLGTAQTNPVDSIC